MFPIVKKHLLLFQYLHNFHYSEEKEENIEISRDHQVKISLSTGVTVIIQSWYPCNHVYSSYLNYGYWFVYDSTIKNNYNITAANKISNNYVNLKINIKVQKKVLNRSEYLAYLAQLKSKFLQYFIIKNVSTSNLLCFSIYKSYHLCYCRSIAKDRKLPELELSDIMSRTKFVSFLQPVKKKTTIDILKVSKFSNDMYLEEEPIEPNCISY